MRKNHDPDLVEARVIIAALQAGLDLAHARIKELERVAAVANDRMAEATERADACELRALTLELQAQAMQAAAGDARAIRDVSTYPPHP